ncbi:MAG TPA: DUF2797 domain-containing protein [Pseudomonadales bacterium]
MLLAGVLADLLVEGGETEPASYTLCFDGGERLLLNPHVGAGLEMSFDGTVICRHCGSAGRRSFGGGYCYGCFRSLARCDLCVVSPDRCHFDAGTCREPEWGRAFCMRPHHVYLANASGIKVGLTRSGRAHTRWLDQGAIQGLVILQADTRRAAGIAEVMLARQLPDRTDWRKMLRADVPEIDLPAARDRLREAGFEPPEGVRWSGSGTVCRLYYPLARTEPPVRTLKLEDGTVRGNLLGMKGQYLILSGGALNVRQHAGYRVTLRLGGSLPDGNSEGDQLGLF